MKLLDAFFELLYPPKCIVCDEPILSYGYCQQCKGKIVPISETMCLQCGCESKFCECKKRIYHFDGITTPYFNEEYARQAVYDLKFSRKFNCVKPFSKEMAKCIKKSYGLENIDLICCVPASKKTMYERGFNQSDLFAKEISEILNIEYNANLLVKKSKTKTQHRIRNIEDRFANVRDGYKSVFDLKGKNILLVDDIKTTGASLDECARQLKFSGAENVYSVVALITRKVRFDKIIDL